MDTKKISELFTVAIPLLILCSCIRLITYYYHWNIPILDYLSVPELLFLFIHPAIIFVAFAAILFVPYAIFFAVLVRWLPKNKNPFAATREGPKVPPEELKKPSAKEKKKINLGWIIVGVFAFGVVALFFFKGIWLDYDIFPTVVIHVLFGMLAMGAVKMVTEPERENELPSLRTVLVVTVMVLASASFFIGRYEANATATKSTPHKLVISDGSIIETNSDLIYLGKTSNYYFLYDNAAGRASIIPMAEVKRIEIGR